MAVAANKLTTIGLKELEDMDCQVLDTIFVEYLTQIAEKGLLPTVTGYILHLNVKVNAFYKAKELLPQLKQQHDKILLMQKEQLVQQGLVARNSRFHEFLLGSTHKMYKEESKESSSINNFNFTNPEIVERLKRIEKKLGTNNQKKLEGVDFTDLEEIE